MARPAKAVFDVSMMAGWAFAALLTGLVALTMVDDTGSPASYPAVAATAEGDGARLTTASAPQIESLSADEIRTLQDDSYNPFDKRQDAQLEQLIAQLHELQQEVSAFHVTTQRMRDENDRLRQRLANLELGSDTSASLDGQVSSVRQVALPTRVDSRSPFLPDTETASKLILDDSDAGARAGDTANETVADAASDTQAVDMTSTGSIRRIDPIASDTRSSDPFSRARPTKVMVSREPLNMDVMVQDAEGDMRLPAEQGVPMRGNRLPKGVERPLSQIIRLPAILAGSGSASQTAFGLDLGQFVSVNDLTSAWNALSTSQSELVGDLRPLSKVTQKSGNKLAVNLIVGPIQNAADAASLCAQLKFRSYDCRVSTYHGQAVAAR